MALTASIIVPTRERAGYLDVALASIAPQAAAAGAEVLVVDDGPSDATRAAAERHGARYVAHDRGRGLNAARNTGARETTAPLLVYVDDDVEVRPGWLAALIAADAAGSGRGGRAALTAAAALRPADVGALTGPIRARFEAPRVPLWGRGGPPVTHLDLGPGDRDCEHAWGANMTVRRAALERIGPFDEARELYGDEQEWQARLKAAGGRLGYGAAAAVGPPPAGGDRRPPAPWRAAP